MRLWKYAILAMIISSPLFAQEQMVLRLNEQGWMKILGLALQYNTSTKGSKTFVVPQNIYKFTLKKSQLTSNPIVPILNEVSNLNMNRDLDFYFKTSDIKISGTVDNKSLKTEISNSHDDGFDLKLSLNLPQVIINGAKLSLCEDKQKNRKECGSGLKATLNNLRISTKGRPVVLSITLRLKTDGQVARVHVLRVNSNLEGKYAPGLDINFSSVDVPRIAIVINGQETELDTSRLKNEILNRKTFLAQKLMGFTADFVAQDLAEMLNVYLINKEVATSYQIYRKDGNRSFNEFLSYGNPIGVFQRQPVVVAHSTNPIDEMMKQISAVIRSAQVNIALDKISTPSNKDIQLSGLLGFMLNGRTLKVRNTLGNSNKPLPALSLNSYRNNDINLAISEPLINGALDTVNSTGLFQELFDAVAKVPGFSVKSMKLHFWNSSSVVGVVNAQVDLKKLESKGIGSWFKNKIAAYLERNNNNGVIYFPIEVQMVPSFKKNAAGEATLDLRILSPFNYVELPNRFNYPSNIPNMTDLVKDGVMAELKEALEPHVNKTYNINIKEFLNKAGVEFTPRSISIHQNAYLLLNMNIKDIKFNSLNPNTK